MTATTADQPVLTATNAEAARAFYASLFGWDLDEEPAVAGPGRFRFLAGTDLVAEAVQAPQHDLDAGLPSAWSTSTGEPPTFPAADLAAATDQALRLGAHVLAPAGGDDVTTLVDPQGAVFRLATAA